MLPIAAIFGTFFYIWTYINGAGQEPVPVFVQSQQHTGPEMQSVPEPEQNPEETVIYPKQYVKMAMRLKRRFQNQHQASPGVASLARALYEKDLLMNRSIIVTIQTPEGTHTVSGSIVVKDHPEWLRFQNAHLSPGYRLDATAIETSLKAGDIDWIPLSTHAQILSTQTDDRTVTRAIVDGAAKAGFVLDIKTLAKQIVNALLRCNASINVKAPYEEPIVTYTDNQGKPHHLSLLATGISDFANSTPGRLHNLHKALDEQVHNVVVKKGETFSLVDALNPPITQDKGWKEDLGILGGGVTKMVGAGICQSATTTYRAALLAGLPIVEKRNHSLFVDHYEFYGIGLDATVFPGVRNLRFTNDTDEDIILQAFAKNDTAYVNVFGKNDGRTASFEGPYFYNSKNRHSALNPLNHYQIGWVRTVKNADGTVRSQEPIVATYTKPLWGSIIKTYQAADGAALLAGLRVDAKAHAAALAAQLTGHAGPQQN